MSSKNSTLFFVDAYSPNEGDSNLVLEYGILRWSENKSERPEVYVHTYLKPQVNYNRIHWSEATKMKISRDFIESKGDLPAIEDMIEADYLKRKSVVCFDVSAEPFSSLTCNSEHVFSIVDVFADIYADDEKARSCDTLAKMCDYVGLIPDDNRNTNYTPLLKRLHQMAALWSFLEELLLNPKRRKSISAGGIQPSFIWPLPESKEVWFENDPKSFNDLSDREITDFFSSNLADRLDWFEMNMYACDWLFNRQQRPIARELAGQRELAEFIFQKILSFRMQIWILIFYSQFFHKKEDSLTIAKNRGDFSVLRPAGIESFTNFIIDNLDLFLSADQKASLIASLINQSLHENDSVPFEHYDYDALRKKDHRAPEGPRLYFTSSPSHGSAAECYKEIRDATGRTIYMRFEIKGRGKERASHIDTVLHHVNELIREASNPFSDIWMTPALKLWIQYITGINFTDIVRPQKMNDSELLNSARITLRKIIEREANPYLQKLYANLNDCGKLIKQENIDVPSKGFNFQGISVEVMIVPSSKMGFIKRLFSFE